MFQNLGAITEDDKKRVIAPKGTTKAMAAHALNYQGKRSKLIDDLNYLPPELTSLPF